MSSLARTAAVTYVFGTTVFGTAVGVGLHQIRKAAADPTHKDHENSVTLLAGLQAAILTTRTPPTLNKVATVGVLTWPIWIVTVAAKKISSNVHITIEHS